MVTTTKAKPADSAQNSAENIPTEHNLPAPAASLDMPLAWIWPSTYNPRRHFDPEQLRELADSILEHGMLEPIVVREREVSPLTLMRVTNAAGETQPVYEVIAGERRFKAAHLAKLATVPVRILTGVDDAKALQLAILENLQRVDLDPIEEARGFAALRDQAGMTQGAIGAAVKRSQPVIAKSLALLKLPDGVLEHIQQGRLTASHGQVLAQFADFPKVASAVAAMAIERKATTRQLELEPLFNTWGLQQAGVIRHISEAEFDRTMCATCPFNAVHNQGQYSSGYCLKPDHFDELQKAATAEKQRAINTMVQAAKRDGKEVLKLKNLPYTAYERIRENSLPAGCTEACACRGVGKDEWVGNETLTPICTNPKRYKSLQDAAAKAAKARLRESVKANLAALTAHLASIDAITSEQLAAMLLPALRGIGKGAWQAATETQAPGLLPDKDKTTLADLARLAPLDLVRLALHALIAHELQGSIDESWRQTDTWKSYKPFVPGVTS